MKIMERGLIRAELIQRREEGCDVDEISTRITAALDEDVGGGELVSLYDELMELPIDESFSYVDRQRSAKSIKSVLIWLVNSIALAMKPFDRTYGAWLGRGWLCTRQASRGMAKREIDKYLNHKNALPLDNYCRMTRR